MGLLDIFRSRRQPDLPAGWSVSYSFQDRLSEVENMSVEDLWATQPALRTVVSFRARNVAQLGMHAFERVDEGDRRRLRNDPLAQLLSRPNADMTTYELLYDLVSTIDLYDRAFWAWAEDDNAPSGYTIRPIPPTWVVGSRGGSYYAPEFWVVAPPGSQAQEIPADQVLTFHGWNPTSGTKGLSPIAALKQTLSEQIQAAEYRSQIWRRGGRVGLFLTRPADAPAWSDTARERFEKSFSEQFSGQGNKAGGTLLLEDGIKPERLALSAKEEQYVDAAKLAISTVASVYHVNPTMVGLLDNANFSNVREFRSMLYTEGLGPTLAQIESRVNTFLVPRIARAKNVYVEFNIAEKLQGNFEEQAAVLSSSTGAPWMTRNEARSRMNLPALDGGDEIVTPLNVLIGGQASPRDSAPDPSLEVEPAGEASRILAARKRGEPVLAVRAKSRPTKKQAQKVAETLTAYFTDQERTVRSVLGAKADGDWWNADRWDAELAAALSGVAGRVTEQVARKQLEALGLDPDDYDTERTLAYLAVLAGKTAGGINEATRQQLEAALASDDPPAAIAHVFELAKSSRAETAGLTFATALAGFASLEAVQQVRGDLPAAKTWRTTSSNPRASHAAMNGETVPIDQKFSNGASWPGDAFALDVDEVAGCRCDVEITFE